MGAKTTARAKVGYSSSGLEEFARLVETATAELARKALLQDCGALLTHLIHEELKAVVLWTLVERVACIRGLVDASGGLPPALRPVFRTAAGQHAWGERNNRSDALLGLHGYVERAEHAWSFPLAHLAATYEATHGMPYSIDSQQPAIDPRRRERGAVFTPPSLARFLTELTLGPILREQITIDLGALRIVDPAVGAGIFLLEALEQIDAAVCRSGGADTQVPAGARRAEIVERCLYGIDVDAASATFSRALLWLAAGSTELRLGILESHIRAADALLDPVNSSARGENLEDAPPPFWREMFPEIFSETPQPGFDIVLSNPPWGKVKPDIKRFNTLLDRDVSKFQGVALREYLEERSLDDGAARVLWEEHEARTREYAGTLKRSAYFTAQRARVNGRTTGGDPDLYKYFLELIFRILRCEGRAGIIVPSAFLSAEGATGLRRLYFEAGSFDQLLEFQNRKRIFPIHPMFRFLVSVYRRGHADGVRVARFGLTDVSSHIENPASEIRLSRAALARVGGALQTIPSFGSRREYDLFLKLHTQHRPLGDSGGGGGWEVGFVRELDMTNDSRHFVSRQALLDGRFIECADGSLVSLDGGRYLPVVEGRMVHQFDSAAKAYRSGEGRTALWEPRVRGAKRLVAHYYVREDSAEFHQTARAGFCDITGPDNERSVLAAIIPVNAVCGNKVPTCRFRSPDPWLDLLWVAVANSFVIDWLVRRRLQTTLNFFVWHQIPFPWIDPESADGQTLIRAAKALTIPSPGLMQGNSRAQLRAKIDAIVADSFELDLQEYAFILSDFPLLDRHQPPIPLLDETRRGARPQAELTSTVTRDVALGAFCSRRGLPLTFDIAELTGLRPRSGEQTLAGRIHAAALVGATAYIPSQLAHAK